ncbi:hypothetical protein ACET3X_001087 [Alternaria dauci]|uniref:BTB domain-containing protein n=1 Tax=Alternaria dauci TaxID=48095 RepID=A0ABR3UW91_9PLEO
METATTTIVLVAPPKDFEMPNLRDDVVPIQVGSKNKSLMHVHTAVLIKSSEVLKNAMKPEWRTDATKPINMSNVELKIFEAYCGWLYTGKVVHHVKGHRHSFLAHVYVLGEQLMDSTFQNAIIAAMIQYSIDYHTVPRSKHIQIIYGGTSTNSPARRLMVDFWVFTARPKWPEFSDLIEETCPDFVNDLVRELVMRRDIPTNFAQRPWVTNPESYRVDSEAK